GVRPLGYDLLEPGDVGRSAIIVAGKQLGAPQLVGGRFLVGGTRRRRGLFRRRRRRRGVDGRFFLGWLDHCLLFRRRDKRGVPLRRRRRLGCASGQFLDRDLLFL